MAQFKIKISHKARNIITLSILLVLVIAVGGYYALIKYPAQLEGLQKQVAELQTKIDALEFVGVQLDETLQKIEQEQIKLAGIDKQIVPEVSSAATYKYLNEILSKSGFLKFDMIFSGTEKRKKYRQNVYSLKGEGSFKSIYKFISYIEEGPQTYKIRKLHMRGVEGVDGESGMFQFVVTFNAEILALFAKIEDLPRINRTLAGTQIASVRNPFYPIIKKNLPPNFYDLLEVERAELKAIMPGKAFVIDHKRNTHILQEGDEVYLGYVKKIDQQQKSVSFTLDKGGIFEEFVLKLRFDEKDKKEDQL